MMIDPMNPKATTGEKVFGFLAGAIRGAVVSLILVLGACSSPQSSDMSNKIVGADTALKNDQVLVNMTLTNVGDTNIVLYSSMDKIQDGMGGVLHFLVVYNGTDTLVCRPCGARPKFPHERDTATLAPGGGYEEEINLTSYYVSPNVKDRLIWDSTRYCTREWLPGVYSVQCRYEYLHQPGFKGGRNLWRGTAVSNVVSLTVRE